MTTVVTILTGGRPALLQKTVTSLALRAPGLVESARVVALVNGHDERATKLLGGLGWVDRVVRHDAPAMLPIGAAFSKLMDAAALPTAKYLFHLEDDWLCLNAGWNLACGVDPPTPPSGGPGPTAQVAPSLDPGSCLALPHGHALRARLAQA